MQAFLYLFSALALPRHMLRAGKPAQLPNTTNRRPWSASFISSAVKSIFSLLFTAALQNNLVFVSWKKKENSGTNSQGRCCHWSGKRASQTNYRMQFSHFFRVHRVLHDMEKVTQSLISGTFCQAFLLIFPFLKDFQCFPHSLCTSFLQIFKLGLLVPS